MRPRDTGCRQERHDVHGTRKKKAQPQRVLRSRFLGWRFHYMLARCPWFVKRASDCILPGRATADFISPLVRPAGAEPVWHGGI